MKAIDELLLSARTRSEAKKYTKNPSHALLVVGSKGNGVDQLVTALAVERLGLNDESILKNTPRALIIRPNKNGNISIDEIRSAWKFAKVSGTKGGDETKLVVIYGANALTTEAQNSLLKLLEEPPEYLSFILGAPSTRSVLSTIDSRSTKLNLFGVSEKEFHDLLVKKGISAANIGKLWIISSGEIYKALSLSKLSSDEGLGFSKQLLAKEPYERLVETKSAMSDRAKATEISRDLYHLSFIAFKQSISAGKDGKPWLAILKKSERTIDNLEANGNVRLNLTSLLVDI